MSNIYAINPIFRRGGGVKNLGLQSYMQYFPTVGFFEESNKYIYFEGSGGYFTGGFQLGAKNVELINTKSSNLEYWGIPYNNTLNFAPVNDNDSFKYAIIRIKPPGILDFAERVNLFATYFAESTGFGSDTNLYHAVGFPDWVTTVWATVYPFVYEVESYGSTKQQKLTTYSVKAPNSSTGRNKGGSEPIKLDFSESSWAVWSSDVTFDYQDYANKLISHLGSYTQQISGSNIEFGFLAIRRGNVPTNWTPKLHIRWFLQRCTDIDVDNDWAHIQLT